MILNILLIDNNMNHLNILSAIEEVEYSMQINILTEPDTNKAIEIAKQNDIHLIILDTNTDDIVHLDVVEQLKEDINTRNIHILFLLDIFKPEQFIDNGYGIEDIDYIMKPIEKYQFLNKINLYLKLFINKKELAEYKRVIDFATIISKSDTKGNITYVNENFCKISGYSEEELLGQPHSILRSPNMPKEAFRDLWKTIQSKRSWKGVVENRAKNGSSYFVKAAISPILNFKNEIVEYISIREDISELKKLQLDELS